MPAGGLDLAGLFRWAGGRNISNSTSWNTRGCEEVAKPLSCMLRSVWYPNPMTSKMLTSNSCLGCSKTTYVTATNLCPQLGLVSQLLLHHNQFTSSVPRDGYGIQDCVFGSTGYLPDIGWYLSFSRCFVLHRPQALGHKSYIWNSAMNRDVCCHVAFAQPVWCCCCRCGTQTACERALGRAGYQQSHKNKKLAAREVMLLSHHLPPCLLITAVLDELEQPFDVMKTQRGNPSFKQKEMKRLIDQLWSSLSTGTGLEVTFQEWHGCLHPQPPLLQVICEKASSSRQDFAVHFSTKLDLHLLSEL